ncbi:MAG: hypothetical protein AAGC95_03370 [Pseudomonadota bacterium]
MGATMSILRFDAHILLRDNFLTVVAGLTGLILVAFAAVGVFRDTLGVSHFQPWIAYVLIMFLITNVSTYGMLFGLVFVEEVETRVRAALMTTPAPPAYLTLLRTLSVFIWLIVQPFVFAALASAAWGATPLRAWQWGVLCAALAPLGAVFMTVLSTVAANRVEALAMGKFFSIATAPPMLLYLLPPDAWYRHLFLIFPTTPAVKAFEALRAGASGVATAWVLWGVVYAVILLVWAVRRHIRRSYKISA